MRLLFRPSLTDLDLVAQDSRRLAPGRAMAAAILVALIIPAMGPLTGFGWGAIVLVGEGLNWLATAPYGKPTPPTRSQRLRYVFGALAGHLSWVSLSLIFWFSNTEGMAFLALTVWSALFFNAIGYAFRSATALLIFALAPLCTMLLAPLLHARWSGPQQALCIAGLILCIIFAVSAAMRNIRAAKILAQSQVELEAERCRAEQANAAKSAFLAFMSHEIRTPLNGVLGMVQAMGRDELTPSQRERLGVVASSGETLLLLLNDLLDLSRIEAGRLDLEDGVVDLAASAEAARKAFAALAAEKGIGLRLVAPAETLGWWAGDPSRIQQIIANLVANAVKFTGRGGVVIALARDADGLAVSVRDTGSGIAEDRLAVLFDRFVQADASTSRQYGGSGLGLAICHQLAELMGGSISVESRLGEGSCFTVRLPLVQAKAPPQAEAIVAAIPQADLRLLVAEDNATNRLVISTLLGQIGLDPQMVENGQEAVAACASAVWDLVLMDVQMPVMDGVAAVRAIRAAEIAEGRPRVPVIALTANAMVAKPIQLAQLLAAMDKALSQDPAEAA